MTALTNVELTEFDYQLIAMLQNDGRRSYSAIARELAVPEKTVRRRANQLLQAGAFEIVAVANPSVLGYDTVALFGFRVTSGYSSRAAMDRISTVPNVDYIAVTAGRFHLVAEVLCGSYDELLSVFDTFLRDFDEVCDVEIFPYVGYHYYEPVYAVSQDKARRPSLEVSHERLDDTDRAIVQCLTDDGRTPFGNIADALGMSESQVRKRVSRMTSQGLIRVTAIGSPTAFGFHASVWIALRSKPNACANDLADSIAALPTIAYVAVCAGRFDLWIEGVCRDRQEMATLLEESIRPLAGVERAELMVVLDVAQRRPQLIKGLTS
jgi:DNA-binding Lrp family transcriptional regulator